MKIDVRSKDSVYITIDNWTFYIDNSTDEQIIDFWDNRKENDDLEQKSKDC